MSSQKNCAPVAKGNGGPVVGAKASAAEGKCGGEDGAVLEFLQKVFDMTLDEGYKKPKNIQVPVVSFKTPDQLRKLFDFSIKEHPEDHDQLLSYCDDVFKYSVKSAHPRFFNQLYAGLDPYGFAGQVVTDGINSSLYTYEVSPMFVLMEQALIKKFCDFVGYPAGDGTFPPGGTYSNMLGLNLARYHKFPEVKEKGMRACPRMVALVSKQCHYSNQKNASLMGLGTDDLIGVECDAVGRMDVDDLERKILKAQGEGAVVFGVVATAGTTVLGAYDPINPIADLCEKHKIWLHVDAAWGGGAMLSSTHRHLLDGIHRSDSVAWNPHKMMMAPLQCCAFFTKHPDTLKNAHSYHVPYLFQLDKKHYDPAMDVGKKIIQCGRKVDTFKLWLMWKAKGDRGMEERIDKAFDNARYLTELVKNRPGFRLLQEPECTQVCFWYVPPSLRALPWNLDDAEFRRRMELVPPKIKERMTERGAMLCGYQQHFGLPNFFRMVVISDQVTRRDMDFVVDCIDQLGRDL